MELESLQTAMNGLPIGEMQYFESIGSTNDFAADWVESGAPDFSLVVADEQIQGRGRAGRKWHTPPGSAIAFSLVLHPPGGDALEPVFYTGLASLAVCETLIEHYGLEAAIKWPNDVLIGGKKACGVLVETHWLGNRLAAIIIGVGLNVAPSALPDERELNFPATSIEHTYDGGIDRPALIRQIVEKCLLWRARLAEPEFLQAWNSRLAYLDHRVTVQREPEAPLLGIMRGLDDQARLLLETEDGRIHRLHSGEIHLRPSVDTSPN